MNYIIFDLEFNQDFDSIQVSSEKDVKHPFEIIQIGAIKLDSSFKFLGSFNSYIRPTIYSKVNPFITELTGITTEKLSLESKFPEVYNSFVSFIGEEEATFCTWGISDMKELYKNVNFHKLDFNLLPKKFIDIQPYVAKILGLPSKNLPNLQFATEKLNIELSFDFHDALNDAHYTAEIFKKTYNSSIKSNIYDPLHVKSKPKKEKVEIDYDGLIKQFSKMYERPITREEEEMIKLAYQMGRTRQFSNKIDMSKEEKN